MRATIMLANIATIVFLFGMFFVQKDINFALMAFSLLCLGGLGEVAANEQESIDKAYMHHYCENVVQRDSDGDNYVHCLYEQFKYVGYDNLKAYALMQKECMHLNVGDLYVPFTLKATLMTRVLMTQVGGAK
jgi:hypothetical protein